MDSGTRITGGGSGYAALLAHAGGALYGTELGSVTLKRIVFFGVFICGVVEAYLSGGE